MKTYTIAKILFTKEVEGKYGKQHNIRFTTNETGDASISCFSKFALKEGQEIYGEIVEKPGTNAKGEEVVYKNFNFAKKESVSTGGMSEDQYKILMREVHAINANILRVLSFVDPEAGLTSAGTPVPDFTPKTMNVVEDYDPANDPDFDPFGGMSVM